MRSQFQLPRSLGQAAAIHQLGPRLGQGTFAEPREFLVKLPRQGELQNGVAEKFQALVGLRRQSLLMGDRRMGQRQLQLSEILEMIAESFLKFVVVSHSRKSQSG